ncbi:hypothetical protein HETIRDRAFT_103929 [Heterobasidion irregulare TC 32-1]|uniref:Uncharacterized protein n=1 Tax=Heterobasidion irregulare (strain TC 32-1) TaxID=747525 RepID=W4JY62_HETIT|nr:uncharacterized protein HETIRDRAFT_103929 [Heterobasidion irregulare TC 32-1]ETW78522.1 hypothetical protein HETIRDRAFT_103929 [Heterobasidion irregulare TC 32-1]
MKRHRGRLSSKLAATWKPEDMAQNAEHESQTDHVKLQTDGTTDQDKMHAPTHAPLSPNPRVPLVHRLLAHSSGTVTSDESHVSTHHPLQECENAPRAEAQQAVSPLPPPSARPQQTLHGLNGCRPPVASSSHSTYPPTRPATNRDSPPRSPAHWLGPSPTRPHQRQEEDAAAQPGRRAATSHPQTEYAASRAASAHGAPAPASRSLLGVPRAQRQARADTAFTAARSSVRGACADAEASPAWRSLSGERAVRALPLCAGHRRTVCDANDAHRVTRGQDREEQVSSSDYRISDVRAAFSF